MSTKIEKKIEAPCGAKIESKPNRLSPHRRRVSFFCGADVLVEQSHKDSCDINLIIARYGREQLAALAQSDRGFYADLSSAIDYKSALDVVREAGEAFNALPSKIRKEFDNDPQQFLAFVENPKNYDKALELGLAKKRPIIDPPASRSDIQALGQALKGSSSGPKGWPEAKANRTRKWPVRLHHYSLDVMGTTDTLG